MNKKWKNSAMNCQSYNTMCSVTVGSQAVPWQNPLITENLSNVEDKESSMETTNGHKSKK